MAVTWEELYERLCDCNEGQLSYIEQHLRLPAEFISQKMIATRAHEVVKLLQQRRDEKLRSALKQLLDKVQSGTKDYLGGRLEHLKKFLTTSAHAENTSPESVGTIKELREKLKDGAPLEKPVLIKVRGTLFPAALLTEGWWERKQQETALLKIEWKNPL